MAKTRTDAQKTVRQARAKANAARAKALGYPSVAAAKRSGWQPTKALGPSKQTFRNAQRRASKGIPEDPKERRVFYADQEKQSQEWSDEHSQKSTSRFDRDKARRDRLGYGNAYYNMTVNSRRNRSRAELYGPMYGMSADEFLRRYHLTDD